MNKRPKTIFCDIDGTLIKHELPINISKEDYKMELLNGTLEKLQEWDSKGYNIILTTGRKESLRKKTEEQLQKIGVIYDTLIMGIGGGDRILINDKKPDGRITVECFCPDRNFGISKIEI